MARSAVSKRSKIAIVGAGITGATIAHQLTRQGFHNVHVFDERDHIGGNIYDEIDARTGVRVHKYGPHIFHTNDDEVWDYVNRLSAFDPYTQRTKAISGGSIYSFPINLHTISQVAGRAMSPQAAADWIKIDGDICRVVLPREDMPVIMSDGLTPITVHVRFPSLSTFEGAAIQAVGRQLYEMFLRDYTRKQWGREPRELPASIAKRLPVRLTFEDNAYNHRHQGMPSDGYAALVDRMLFDAATVLLRTKFKPSMAPAYDHIFYTGPIDEWFDYVYGSLPYRTLDFDHEHFQTDNYQGCAVMNYCDASVKWTRSVEHRHFYPHRAVRGTVVTREYSREWQPGDIRYYPVRLAAGDAVFQKYWALAQAEQKVTFAGRLGTFSYLDMDVAIRQALDAVKGFTGSR